MSKTIEGYKSPDGVDGDLEAAKALEATVQKEEVPALEEIQRERVERIKVTDQDIVRATAKYRVAKHKL